jgi:hypothetical protein
MQSSPDNSFLSKKFRVFLVLFIFFDLALSFNQYYNTPIDGDLTSFVLPAPKFNAVLTDPFGLEMLASGNKHSETNRFFSILMIAEYFKSVPFASQLFLSPIDSIYFSVGIFKLLIQILFLVVIGSILTGSINLRSDKFILAVAIATVFFQSGGYSVTMGIIDPAISYSVIYSLSFVLALVLLFPGWRKITRESENNISLPAMIVLMVLAVLIPLMGSQVPIFVFAALATMIVGRLIFKTDFSLFKKKIFADKKYLTVLAVFLIACIYSCFISLFNPERNLPGLTLSEMYLKIPGGLKNIFFGKPGLWILTILILVNTFILKRSKGNSSMPLLLKWSALFVMIYILFLPLDGFYEFRPNVIRRDNFIPVIILLIGLFLHSSLRILTIFKTDSFKLKLAGYYLLLVALLFTISDSPDLRMDNCQRASLEMLSIADQKVVPLSDRCAIASWYIISDYKESSENAFVFNYWKITEEPKYYFQR